VGQHTVTHQTHLIRFATKMATKNKEQNQKRTSRHESRKTKKNPTQSYSETGLVDVKDGDVIDQRTYELPAGTQLGLCVFHLRRTCTKEKCEYRHTGFSVKPGVCAYNLTDSGCKHKSDPSMCNRTHVPATMTCWSVSGHESHERDLDAYCLKRQYVIKLVQEAQDVASVD
jgi:hypothetical protein